MERRQFRWLLVRRALFKKRGKSMLILLAVAMGASVAAALLNLEADLRVRMNRELRDYGPNVIVMPAAGGPATLLDDRSLAPLQDGITGKRILAFTPELFVPARADGIDALLVGADLMSVRRLFPGWEWSASEDGLYVGVRLARKLKASRGSVLEIKVAGKTEHATVTGTVEGGEAEDDQIFTGLATAQQWSGRQGFQVIAASALGEAQEVESWFRSYAQFVPGTSFEIVRKIAAAETQILDKISRLMALILAIIFITLFFCINTTVSAILLARQPEIALMRVLGARRKQIMHGLTLELLTLASLGGLLGYGIGMLMAQVLGRILFQTFIIPRVSVFLITLFSALAMVVVSSFLPIRRAINRPAALVLKEA